MKLSKDRTYMLTTSNPPLSMLIASRDLPNYRLLYFDSEKGDMGTNRALRYAKNQQSPFQDEQDETAILEPIIFEDGKLTVRKENSVLQRFLSLHPTNRDNNKDGGGHFYEFDPEKEAEENIKNLNIEVDALIAARELDLNTMMAIARVHLNTNVDKATTKELQRDILLFARASPVEFMEALEDTDLGVNNLSARAFSEGYVTLRSGKDVYYNLKDNKKKIITLPFGTSPEDGLTSWLLSDKGKEFFAYLTNEFEK
jgi:hypothetical protein